MNVDRAHWTRVHAIFESALERPDEHRDRFIADACRGDTSLLADLTGLLSAHAQAGNFLESAVVRTALSFDDGTLPSTLSPLDTGNFTGRTVAHYRLDQRIGAGGMGVVYRAQDLALGRTVAIKLLSTSFSDGLRGTLLRETDACARLQHPAIATYFESGDEGASAFIAMELVEGQTLLQRLERGALPVDEAVAIAHCVLEGLVHAHAAGILHCDIKPANIVLTGPRSAKLLDFGLAKHVLALAPDGATVGETAPGVVAGTIGYMSPEQILSEPLDPRSDLFQVGAVLYEMLTGTPAFGGPAVLSRVAAVLSKPPPAIAAPDVPEALAALVARALSRTRERRYPDAAAMLRDLIAVGSGEWTPELPATLAVLDFDDSSADADSAWIGSGLADSLGAALARGGLRVVPRDAVLKSRAAVHAVSAGERAVELGLMVGCRWVLAGEYRKTGDRLRITARLVDVAPGTVLAQEDVEGPMAELFTMHDRLAAFAASSLELAAPVSLAGARPALSAYECYARGQRLFKKLEKGSMDRGFELYEQAVELDPHFAPALAGLAAIYAMRFTYTTDPSVLERAASYARRAIEADPFNAEARAWHGYALFRLHRMPEADEQLRFARELDPSSFWGFYFGCSIAHRLGRSQEALALLLRAIELEPRAAYTWYGLGSLHLDLGNLSEALWSYDKARLVNSQPDASPFPDVGGYIAECHRRARRLGEARRLCLESLDLIERSDHMYRDSFRAFSLVVLGTVALDQQDAAAAHAAFTQAIVHVKGRPRTLAGGWLVVRALAGLACSDRDMRAFEEAHARFTARSEFDFSWLWQCDEPSARDALSRAALTLGSGLAPEN